ncbi:MAG: ABC transporter permease [Clostridium sp.]|nr:ABC transporter permease [Clostridium sp.]
MLKYLVKRIGTAVVTLFVAATITFFVMNLVPGDPFMSEKAPTAAAKAAMEAKYGLDKPLVVQYGNYLKNLLHGDFGVSYVQAKNKPIMDIIKQAFPISAKIGAIAVVVATVIGIPLGCLSALRREKWQDNVIRVVSTVGIAVPGFVVATSFMILFAVKLKLVPASGLSTAASYVLPVVTLALSPCSYIARLMRSSMLDVIGQDYIRTARAKGMSEFITTFKHALRNSLIPVITYMGPMIANVLTGGFVVEKIFNIPGLGRYFVKSIESRDYTIIMGVTIFYAAILILMTLICDIIYKLVDLRIKLDA